MRDCEINEKSAGCEKEAMPVAVAVGRNLHEAFVTLVTVNSGKKKAAEGSLGTQSILKLLPVNGKSAGKNACTVGKTSKTDTGTLLKVT
jgi:hypothetical protein